MHPEIPAPGYEAYIIRRSNVSVQVHAFKEIDAATNALQKLPPLYDLEMPGGRAIAIVGSIESAHAILPVRAQQATHVLQTGKAVPEHTELWINC